MTMRDLATNQIAVPQHVAIIMDGNGRWAAARGENRSVGHEHGVEAVREAIAGAAECGVKYLTLFAFSTENWRRPQDEIDALMQLLSVAIDSYLDELVSEGVKLRAIGDLTVLPDPLQKKIHSAELKSAGGDKLYVQVALNYGGRQEIVFAAREAARRIAKNELTPEQIDEPLISSLLFTAGVPDPELLIRTSGEQRISNFLLWQLAYAELCFIPVLWPDFKRLHFHSAVEDFQNRSRRFGGV